MPLPNLIDTAGHPVHLERELASGGEGIVYTLRGDESRVVKLYRQAPAPAKGDKLRWMVDHASEELATVAAWPTGLVYSAKQLAGFVMPRLTGFESIQHLYNPAQRLRFFTRTTWAFLVASARNCAAAFDELHQAGVIIGDVNQSNLRVSQQAIVRFIDCDSFQVTANGQHHLCEVGVAHYTPPELQGKSFVGLVRTLNHDRFGLAVVLFQLLFLGRHPYAGIFQGKGELSFEDAIAQYRFAYGPRAGSVQMAPPPFTPTFDDLPPAFLDLFARAFERGSEQNRRPGATEWHAALATLSSELMTCKADPGHQFWKGTADCPWCRIAGARGPDYFLGAGDPSFVFTPDEPRLRELLRRLQAIDAPMQSLLRLARKTFVPQRPPTPTALPAGFHDHVNPVGSLALVGVLGVVVSLFGCLSSYALVGGLFVAVGSFAASFWRFHRSVWYQEYRRRRTELESARTHLNQLEASHTTQAGPLLQRQIETMARVQSVLDRCQALPREYVAEVAGLAGRLEELAQKAYLAGFYLSDATIPKIGEGRKQTLASYNINTAADLDPEVLARIRGFGRALIGNLLAWRAECLKGFTFDRTQKIPEAEQRVVARKFRKAEQTLLAEADRILTDLETGTGGQELTRLETDLDEAVARWMQAQADWALFQDATRFGEN